MGKISSQEEISSPAREHNNRRFDCWRRHRRHPQCLFSFKAGKKVALIESGELGNGATLRTTAFITKVIDSSFTQIADLFGNDIAKTVWESGDRAIDEFEKIIKTENIECEFCRCSNFIFANTKKQFEGLEEDFNMYKKMKMAAALYGNKNGLKRKGKDLNFPNSGYLEIPDQAKFDPAKFIFAISQAAVTNGARIFEETEALEIAGENPITVKTSNGDISAKDVVIATYKPFTNRKTHFKKGMYRSYILELEIPTNTLREGIYEDEDNPYHYFRVDRQKGTDRVILGGEDHKDIFGNLLTKKSFESLEEYAKNIFKDIKFKLTNRWEGPILEPSDGLPLIGSIKPHYYVASAFSGNGMTYSMISAILIRDLIIKKKSAWEKAYDPKRFLWRPKRLGSKALDYIQEFVGGAAKNMLK
jgi:glycine/D-amino acid oxidase-like deaminating enzyme